MSKRSSSKAGNRSHLGKKKPGPRGRDAPLLVEDDIADAAHMLELTKKGKLEAHELAQSSDYEEFGIGRLSATQENTLARRVQSNGDIDARNTLVLANMGLVHLVANQFARPPLRYEDLAQEGTMGLIRATETFEPDRGIRFSTYSVYWIRAKIQRLLQKQDRDDIPTISGAESLINEKGKKRRARAHKLSLDNHYSEDSDSRSLEEILPSGVEDPEWIMLHKEQDQMVQRTLTEIIGELDDTRLYDVIQWRLLADEPETLLHLGKRLHLSREGARLLESKMIQLARRKLVGWNS